MRLMKALLATVLIMALCMGIFTGCKQADTGSDSTTTTTATATTKAAEQTTTEQAEVAEGPPILKKYDPPVVLTTATWVNADMKYREGDTWDDNVWTRFVRDRLGIIFKYAWTAPGFGEFEEKLILNIAAGEPFPDVVFDFFNQGHAAMGKVMENTEMLMPVNEAFEKYASPTFKKAIELAGKEIWLPFTKDGKAYAIPFPNDGVGNANCMFYRKDWLDAVGLETPKTIDELEVVLDAFTNRDPDKDNEKDTYGITFGWKEQIATYLSETSWVFGAYGAIPSIWYKDSSGNLIYGSIQPQIKEGLAKLRDWYAKGYIDPQAAMYNVWEAKDKGFQAEKSGVISVPVWGYWVMQDLFTNNPNAKVVADIIPAGPSGKAMRLGYGKLGSVFFISKDCKNIEAVFNYINTLYERKNPDNKEFQYGYIEGCDYALDENGNPLFDEEMKKVVPEGKYEAMSEFMVGKNNISNMPFESYDIVKRLAEGATPVTPAEIAQSKQPPLLNETMLTISKQFDISLADHFCGPVTPTMSTKWDQLKKMEFETFLQIIYGELPLEAFDNFVENWKSQGGDQITKEVNDWYKSAQ